MSGGGRCNFTNMYSEPANFLSQNPHFCKSALARYSQWDFIALVGKHGVPYHEKKLGQLFCDNKSRDILDMLLGRVPRGRRATAAGLHDPASRSAGRGGLPAAHQRWGLQLRVAGDRHRRSVDPDPRCHRLRLPSRQAVRPQLLPTRAGLVPFTITEPQLKALCTELSGTSVRTAWSAATTRASARTSCSPTAASAARRSYRSPRTGSRAMRCKSTCCPISTCNRWLPEQQAERPNSELKTLLAELFTKKMAGLTGRAMVRLQAAEAVHPR